MDALRTTGAKAWAIVGIVLATAAGVLLVILLKPLVIAVGAALCVALALSPAVDALARHGMRRGLGAGLGVLLVIGIGFGVLWLVVKGLASQWPEITRSLDKGLADLQRWANDAGIPGSLAESAKKSVSEHRSTLLSGLLPALGNLAGTAAMVFVGTFVFLFTTFFMLKDGHAMARVTGELVPLGPAWVAQVGRIIRGYVVGLTLLGAFNAAVVGLGALVLGVPLVGALIVVTLIGNYVPYLGAWIAGAYTVLIALAAGGLRTAAIMTVVVFLANGTLQTLLQPFAYGAALRMRPLTILLATVVGGLLAGIIGVMIAAPVAAVVQHTAQLLRARRDGTEPGPGPGPGPGNLARIVVDSPE